MTDIPGEVAGLPLGGPATLALLKSEMKLPPPGDPLTADDERLQTYVDAVNDQIRTWPTAQRSSAPDTPEGDRTWRRNTVLGAVRLCVRFDMRRNSPEGVAAFADGGVVYVQRNDPDLAQMLDLGPWATPKVR